MRYLEVKPKCITRSRKEAQVNFINLLVDVEKWEEVHQIFIGSSENNSATLRVNCVEFCRV